MGEVVIVCPTCGSDDIRERNSAYAELRVLEWERDERDGMIVPLYYDTDVSVDWECEDVEKQYVCHGCGDSWTLDDLRAHSPRLPPMTNPDATPPETRRARVCEILAHELDCDLDKLTPDARLGADFGADSLDVLEVGMALETKFNIDIPDDVIVSWRTVADITAYIDSRVPAEVSDGR